MAKRSVTLEALAIGLVSVLAGLVSLAFGGSIFNFFFVAIVIAVLWNYTGKVNELLKRVSVVESRLSKETPTAPSTS